MQVELEENKRNLSEIKKARAQLAAEVDNLKDHLESEQNAKSAEQGAHSTIISFEFRPYIFAASRRRLQEQLQELQISAAANTSMHGGERRNSVLNMNLNIFRPKRSRRELQSQGGELHGETRSRRNCSHESSSSRNSEYASVDI